MFRSCGAGVLPFRVTRQGTVVFLLAKERHAHGWHGSGKLSAFEGGRERCESPSENAVREFTEESMAILYSSDRHTREASQMLTQELERSEFALCVCNRDARRKEEHRTFVKRFEWSEDLVKAFEERRDALLRIRDLGDRLRALEAKVPQRHPFFRPDDVLEVHGEAHRVMGVRIVPGEAVEKGAGDGPGKGPGEAPGEGPAEEVLRLSVSLRSATDVVWVHRVAFGPMDEACKRFVEALHVRTELTAAVRDLPRAVHGALRVTTAASGAILGVAVRHEWLEKDCIREYTIPELVTALQEQGPSLFRPYFLLVVRQVIAQFIAPASPFSCITNSEP